MTTNYLKTPAGTLFFFNDFDPESRRTAWELAMAECSDPTKLCIWSGTTMGRYPHECMGEPHPVVDERLKPISPNVRVIGYEFEAGRGGPLVL